MSSTSASAPAGAKPNPFRRAQRKRANVRIALDGPSGSGKTYSALLLAKGLGDRVALIDTEHGSAELYADLYDWDHARLDPPYTPERYLELMRLAYQAGYDVVILDSLSHAWAGQGGLLEIKDKVAEAQKGKNKNEWAAWRHVTPQHNRLVDAILRMPCHVIATMRTTTAWDVVTDRFGKKKPVKIGQKPIQREGIEYEFTLVLDLEVDGHGATASKDRTQLFDGKDAFVPGVEHGRAILEWVESGAPERPEPAPAPAPEDEGEEQAPPPPSASAPEPTAPADPPAEPERQADEQPAPVDREAEQREVIDEMEAALAPLEDPAPPDLVDELERLARGLPQPVAPDALWDRLVTAGHAVARRRMERASAERIQANLIAVGAR